MSKLRMLFAIPCFALSMALVGCGGSESTFEPIEINEADLPGEDAYDPDSSADPHAGAAPAPEKGGTDG